MADSSYPFPPDRFDEEADAVSFHGAHRAEEPFWRQNLLYIVIIAAAFLTLLVLLFVIGGMGGDDRAADPTSPASSSAPAQKPSEKPSEEPAAEADKGVQVMVVNAGGVKGMAGDWRDALKDSGWSDVKIGTSDNRQEEPVVYYREEADAATAQALAKEVGVGEARQSDEYDSAITFLAVTEPGKGGDQGDGTTAAIRRAEPAARAPSANAALPSPRG